MQFENSSKYLTFVFFLEISLLFGGIPVHAFNVPDNKGVALFGRGDNFVDDPDFTLRHMPWIKPFFDTKSRLLKFPQFNNKEYNFGNNYVHYITESCRISNSTEYGTCKFLFHCPGVYQKITDFETFQNYFCTVEVANSKNYEE